MGARGWYAQFGNKQGVDFYDFRRFDDGQMRGAGSDGVGEFDLYGMIDANGYFTFDKQYRGAHTVVYRGRCVDGVLAGKWEIPGNCDGTFNIVTGWQRWLGGFWQFGNFSAMELEALYVGDSGVCGRGSDNIGQFRINGYKDGDQVWFAKAYIGQH